MRNCITYTVDNNLCTGCGICEDVCPTKSIAIQRIDDVYQPIVNEDKCLSPKCGRCLKVCPGIGVDLVDMSKELYPNSNRDKYIGYYTSLYTGYSLDDDIRYHAASGGLLSQFLIYLLDKKIIEGAVVTGFSEDDHITPISYIAKTKDDIIRALSSKYCPVTMNKIGNEIANSEGQYIIVGLPCHIQGFRKRSVIDHKFRGRILGYFSIYCSSNRTFGAQDFLLRKYCIEKEKIRYFAYRDEGCLGNLTIVCNNNKLSIPYTDYNGSLRSFFKPMRCLSCIDHYGELADVCFGDIHINPYWNDVVGISSCIVRNHIFDVFLKQAVTEGYIKIDTLESQVLNESQKTMLYPKQRRANAVMHICEWIGKPVAVYDRKLEKPLLKDYFSELFCLFQRFIGKRKYLWFIIDFFYKRRRL